MRSSIYWTERAWDAEEARDRIDRYVAEELHSAEAVLIVDETGFLKKGQHSAGVKRQYSGTARRIENSQIGVFLCYASEQGSALVDRELYPPQERAEDRERRREAGIPEAVEFATKPELARRMIGRALDAGATAAWFAADEVYGHDSKLRRFLEGRQMAYALAVASDQRLWQLDLTQPRVDAIAQSLPDQAWRRLPAGFGSKGERLYDWARMRFSGRMAGRGRFIELRDDRFDELVVEVAHPNAAVESVEAALRGK